jgi:hypothetical protein
MQISKKSHTIYTDVHIYIRFLTKLILEDLQES